MTYPLNDFIKSLLKPFKNIDRHFSLIREDYQESERRNFRGWNLKETISLLIAMVFIGLLLVKALLLKDTMTFWAQMVPSSLFCILKWFGVCSVLYFLVLFSKEKTILEERIKGRVILNWGAACYLCGLLGRGF